MFSLVIAAPESARELLIAELWEMGSAGIVELDAERVRAFFEGDGVRDGLRARFPEAEWREEEEHDWVAEARSKLPPMLVGERFFLAPEWCDDAAPEGRFRIVVNPGQAFGTGFHETTQLCIEALEEFVRPGAAVLDVGTGSGILAQAAMHLGAARVWGCDNDPVAVEVAREKLPQVFVGSVDAVRSAVADVVVANLTAEVIVPLAEQLLRAVRPGGVVLLSGIERHEVEMVRAAVRGVSEVRVKGNWVLLVVGGI
jgi:ribosomal protein L11 methyltransferase